MQENAFLHNKYINYLITELKPVTGEIIRQGAAEGLIVCQQPDALAEIVLLVLVVKLDNTLIPSTKKRPNRLSQSSSRCLRRALTILKGL